MPKCAPGGGEALSWRQNAGGSSPTSHPTSVPRCENARAFARVASSSRRMPAINPSNPYFASASFSPSVLRAADRAAGGSVGSIVSIGGGGAFFRSQFRFFPWGLRRTATLRKFFSGGGWEGGKGGGPKKR